MARDKIFKDTQDFKEQYRALCVSVLGREFDKCTDKERYSMLARLIAAKSRAIEAECHPKEAKKVYYFSLEFLLGPLLDNYLLNYGLRDLVADGISEMGSSLDTLIKQEVDPGLGNGGLGRLAACFLDSMAHEGIAGFGNGMRYRYGLFRQEIEDGRQVECTDNWLEGGFPWESRKDGSSVTVRFGGEVVRHQDETGRFWFTQEGGECVRAVPYDVPIVGYGGKTVNKLRLWSAEPCEEDFDLDAFNAGDYARANKFRSDVEAISTILYPNDAGEHGRILRLKQEYLFVSAGLQSILRTYEHEHGRDWDHFADHVCIHTNDTHPAMCGPELMRLLVDVYGLDFDQAFKIASASISYTNHTVMPEALEKWPIEFLKTVAPKIADIIVKLDLIAKERYADPAVAIIQDDVVHMANLAIHFGCSVNGVAALHTKILEDTELAPFYKIYPEKFSNKTNGITFRRWIMGCNPELTGLLDDTIGTDWHKSADLTPLKEHLDDKAVIEGFERAKDSAKGRMRQFMLENQDAHIPEDAIIDVQVKRIHEYKRQQMLALYIIWKYLDIKNGNLPARPITIVFGGKAAPAYVIAQDIIHLILTLSDWVAQDPDVSPYLQVLMVQNYNVTAAEHLIPAADISEQISLASKEASGTSNMKFMLNGAVTLCTLDGANVEIAELVGKDDIYTFGASSQEVERLYAEGSYDAFAHYSRPGVKLLVDFITNPRFMATGDAERLRRLHDDIVHKDWFMALLDLEEYIQLKEQVYRDYEDRHAWIQKALVNVAMAGTFSSDRTIAQYDEDIWHLS